MKHKSDKDGSKLLLFLVLIIVIYLAFFGFNVGRAYEFTLRNILELTSLFAH